MAVQKEKKKTLKPFTGPGVKTDDIVKVSLKSRPVKTGGEKFAGGRKPEPHEVLKTLAVSEQSLENAQASLKKMLSG